MKVTFTLTDLDIRKLLAEIVTDRLGIPFTHKDLPLRVRSNQNYRNREWEMGEMQISVEVDK